MKNLYILAGVAGLFVAANASAIQYEWTLDGGTSAGGSQLSFTSNGQTLKARGYSTPTASGATSAPSYSGNFLNASIYKYSGSGLGVGNNTPNDANDCNGSSCNPEHAVDNQQAYDVLVFEAPSKGWDFESLSIGWHSNDADVRVFVGGNNLGAGFDFTSMCFTGCASGNNIIGSSNFTDLGTLSNLQDSTGGTRALNTNATGRYLVVSGALGQYNDYFKIDALKATPTPEPQTLALLAGGIAIMGIFIRRRSRLV